MMLLPELQDLLCILMEPLRLDQSREATFPLGGILIRLHLILGTINKLDYTLFVVVYVVKIEIHK
jgi:hypothetical protein